MNSKQAGQYAQKVIHDLAVDLVNSEAQRKEIRTSAQAKANEQVQTLVAKIHAEAPKLSTASVAKLTLAAVKGAKIGDRELSKNEAAYISTTLSRALRAVVVDVWAPKGIRVKAPGAGRPPMNIEQFIAKSIPALLDDDRFTTADLRKYAQAILDNCAAREKEATEVEEASK